MHGRKKKQLLTRNYCVINTEGVHKKIHIISRAKIMRRNFFFKKIIARLKI